MENDSPQGLVELLEVFVGLLRAKPNTKPVDVELFFADHAKLVSKMNRVETTQCTMAHVDSAIEQLEAIRNQFGPRAQRENVHDLSKFVCLLEWSLNYCKASQIDLKRVTLEREVAQLKLDLERAHVAIQKFERIEEDARRFEFEDYFDAAIERCEHSMEVMTRVVHMDEQQAMKYQKNYKKFEDAYFMEYMNIVREINQ